MTDAILALIPDYGAYIVALVVFLACLAVPLPASIMVLAAGSFAIAGDLSLWLTLIAVFLAFVAGDQVAFAIASKLGRPVITALRLRPRMAPILERSETLLEQRGSTAVLLSHTLISPTCPYVTYLCGAGGLSWSSFTIAAIPGALIWTVAYVGLGAIFSTQLEQVVILLGNFFGLVIAGCAIIGCAILLRNRWHKMHRDTPVSTTP